MHVESAERGVSPLPCFALPIGVDHSRSAELIFRIVPAESHDNVRRMWVVDFGIIQMEGSWQTLFGKNHAGKIRLLQKFDKTAGHRRVLSDHVKEHTAPVPNQHDFSRFRLFFEFALRNKIGVGQDFSLIDGSSDR